MRRAAAAFTKKISEAAESGCSNSRRSRIVHPKPMQLLADCDPVRHSPPFWLLVAAGLPILHHSVISAAAVASPPTPGHGDAFSTPPQESNCRESPISRPCATKIGEIANKTLPSVAVYRKDACHPTRSAWRRESRNDNPQPLKSKRSAAETRGHARPAEAQEHSSIAIEFISLADGLSTFQFNPERTAAPMEQRSGFTGPI